jgi:transposase-like protein
MQNETNISQTKETNLSEFGKRFPNEQSCIDFLSEKRWGGKPVCVHCGNPENIYKVSNGRLFKCSRCRKQFSVRIGTIFEDSPLPLWKWFLAIYILTAHKKGISSLQLHRDIGVTQKTAWFMLHRIRYAVATNSFQKPLNGIVEMDETYFGGVMKRTVAPKNDNKSVVFGIVERGGEVRAHVVRDATKRTLYPIIAKNVSIGATVMSDEAKVYKRLDKMYAHKSVDHLKVQYVNGNIHTNGIEGFWSHLKRGVKGVQHHVSRDHLHRYVKEYEYRFNTRKETDFERFNGFFHRCAGRLTYKKLPD